MDGAHFYWHLEVIKMVVSRQSNSFCQLIANYASLCAVELEVNEKKLITCKRQNHSFMSKNILPKTTTMKFGNC